MRSGWDDGATVVGFRCTDFFGQHHHLDQGSFFIFRNGLLALDTGTYQRVAGNQMKTDAHNTLLLGGEGQRPQKYQSASTLEAFTDRLPKGLETGDILFYRDSAAWTAVVGQFAQAYQPEVIQSCVRQLLFLRPSTVIVVDQLAAPEGTTLPEVHWLLHVPGQPQIAGQTITASNARSYLRCRSLAPGRPPQFEASYRTPAGPSNSSGNPSMLDASRVVYSYEGKARLNLVHALEVGDGQPSMPAEIKTSAAAGAGSITLVVAGKTFEFSTVSPFEIRSRE
jgi:hypothetical protein